MEEYEAKYRRIEELKAKISEASRKIVEAEKRMREIEREYPWLLPEDIMYISREYRSLYFRVLAYRSWISRWAKMIEELLKVLPPITYVKIQLTFSIDTEGGKEPFYAEVTCSTIIEVSRKIEVERVVNATLKMFWIHFDAFKALADISHKPEYKRIKGRIIEIQKEMKEIGEEDLDALLKEIIELKGFERPPEQYLTKKAILKIGVEEYPAAGTEAPKYPYVLVEIEKSRERYYKVEKTLIIAMKTDIDMIKKLEVTK